MLKIVTLSALLMGMTVLAATAADTKVVLSVDDCVKCHSAQAAFIAANGGKHKTEISCQDCHASHRPTSKNNIPLCNQCHSGKSHYSLTGCLRCHTNPHTPKIITLPPNTTNECLTCHTKQNAQLKEFKSKHSALSCSFCHNVHGKKPLCTQCHKSHSVDITASDCKRCHKAHMPKNVTYPSDTTNKMCSACHKKAFELHSKTDTKHKGVNCVTCHKDKHKTVPQCQGCHGVPHPARIMAKFPKCGNCHSIAHDLNRWEVAPAKTDAADKNKAESVKSHKKGSKRK